MASQIVTIDELNTQFPVPEECRQRPERAWRYMLLQWERAGSLVEGKHYYRRLDVYPYVYCYSLRRVVRLILIHNGDTPFCNALNHHHRAALLNVLAETLLSDTTNPSK